MYAEISSAIAGLKTVSELVKAAHSLSNYNELVAAVSEVSAKLMDATAVALASQEKQSALAQQVRDLEQALMDLEDWKATAKDYELKSIGTLDVCSAYAYTPGIQAPQNRHLACAKCFQDKKRFILNTHERHSYRCPNCGVEISPTLNGGRFARIESVYE